MIEINAVENTVQPPEEDLLEIIVDAGLGESAAEQ